MSQPSRRRAALGAAVLGVLLALTSALGIASPASAAAAHVATTSPASYSAASGSPDHAAVRTAHTSALGSTASPRGHGGLGFSPAALAAGSLLVLAGLCLHVAVRRTHGIGSWRSTGAAGPRAPPALASC